MYYLKNTNFWMFGLFFFFYFFIMGAYFPFFPIWLHDINHISKSDTGIIFAAISLFSLLFQPLFGLLSDKLGLRKYLLWIITGMLVMFAPFFIFIFGPASSKAAPAAGRSPARSNPSRDEILFPQALL